RALLALDHPERAAQAVDGDLQPRPRRLAHELSGRSAGRAAPECYGRDRAAHGDAHLLLPSRRRRLCGAQVAVGNGSGADEDQGYAVTLWDGAVSPISSRNIVPPASAPRPRDSAAPDPAPHAASS